MKRFSMLAVLSLSAVALAVPALRADVKTTEKITFKLEGLLGRMMRGGDAITSTVAVKGARKLSMNSDAGEIIDLTEEKMYRVDVKKKQYQVLTFEQLRKEWQEAQKEMEKNADQMRQAQGEPEDKEPLEFSAEVKETGQQKAIAGHDTREVVLTITGKKPGKTLEAGGGMVMTSTMWLAPRIPALDEIQEFDAKFVKAIYGDEGAAAIQQMAMVLTMFASAKPLMAMSQAESRKLAGTPLQTTMVMERIRGTEQTKAAESQGGGGGGLGGALARRMMAGRGQSQPRSTVMTTSHEVLTIATSVTAEDIAIPAGFKEKK